MLYSDLLVSSVSLSVSSICATDPVGYRSNYPPSVNDPCYYGASSMRWRRIPNVNETIGVPKKLSWQWHRVGRAAVSDGITWLILAPSLRYSYGRSLITWFISGCIKSIVVCLSVLACAYLEGPTYSSSERVIRLTGTEGRRLTIACTANGSAPISYEFFKVCRYIASKSTRKTCQLCDYLGPPKISKVTYVAS